MDLDGKRIVVVGGSRGLGFGMVGAFVARAANVTVVARDSTILQAVGEQLAVTTVAADATSADAAKRIMSETRPDVVIMNAGAEPPMDRIDRIGWEAFTTNWNVDVKAALHWVQAALTLPMAPGGLVVLVSSGAAVQGSPLSGGYAGAKRAQWFIAKYAEGLSTQLGLGLRFRVIVPRQMFAGTGVGNAGISGYAAAAGRTFAEQAAAWPDMTPRGFGDTVAELIGETALEEAMIYAVRGDTGVTVINDG
ncbi:SDR family NAD(P)-dependent oxidoreductase [Rhizobium sp. LARHSG275]|uniref:SDR family NAD(P)-dependent oxidoreductase n=1 Tax=Rhizobium TaxID=379 RepID=UPI001389B093|nr:MULTISPECIES: SDR family NAD(P)-dependent oxidoreductase [Rhizobium]MBY5406313.1 SDR family NAD(P)-dependent oxidoreductase [Rhizobium leguminosarum]NDK54160.1 SDR family NAD(P)-dependent oxidoreductase [Rhizobium laguerreae]UWM78048.1 SDR family NAD(P)-dependent oxidoreductase [Rhizobium leguminosarum bv. viciae]UWM84094.1 SDR family NAD(P)-dependent oxidoreductase [Rhizobium leguminosarum bv. viciae]